ncbi:hypothetical protein OY671_010306, partial [Metschnikowia pulcherrima]
AHESADPGIGLAADRGRRGRRAAAGQRFRRGPSSVRAARVTTGAVARPRHRGRPQRGGGGARARRLHHGHAAVVPVARAGSGHRAAGDAGQCRRQHHRAGRQPGNRRCRGGAGGADHPERSVRLHLDRPGQALRGRRFHRVRPGRRQHRTRRPQDHAHPQPGRRADRSFQHGTAQADHP